MKPHWNKGKGAAVQWLRDHAAHEDDDCLIWPFNRNSRTGYGAFGYLGRLLYAHRFMCALVNGPAPTPKHQASHSCGLGHDGCVNPRHLSWKLNGENQLDRRQHGTRAPGAFRWRPKLSPEQVVQIRALKGHKTQDQIAAMFGVTRQNIGAILNGKSQRGNTTKVFTDDEVREIRALDRSLTLNDIAEMYGAHPAAIDRIRNGRSYTHVHAPE